MSVPHILQKCFIRFDSWLPLLFFILLQAVTKLSVFKVLHFFVNDEPALNLHSYHRLLQSSILIG